MRVVGQLEARRVAVSARFGSCMPAGQFPTPRTVGVDLQRRIVKLKRFGVLGESNIGYGVFVETPESLADLRRFESCSHSIQHGEGRPCKGQPR